MIYVASPYSDDSAEVMQARYEQVKAFTAELMREGLVVYSPIVHGHDVATAHDLPGDWAFWKNHCLGMLRKADRMIVFGIEGWRHSVGVQAEIAFCESCGIAIDYRYLARGQAA